MHMPSVGGSVVSIDDSFTYYTLSNVKRRQKILQRDRLSYRTYAISQSAFKQRLAKRFSGGEADDWLALEVFLIGSGGELSAVDFQL